MWWSMTKILWHFSWASQLHTIYNEFECMDLSPRILWRFIEFVIIEPQNMMFYWIRHNWAHKTWRFNINVIEIVIVILTICFDIHHFVLVRKNKLPLFCVWIWYYAQPQIWQNKYVAYFKENKMHYFFFLRNVGVVQGRK